MGCHGKAAAKTRASHFRRKMSFQIRLDQNGLTKIWHLFSYYLPTGKQKNDGGCAGSSCVQATKEELHVLVLHGHLKVLPILRDISECKPMKLQRLKESQEQVSKKKPKNQRSWSRRDAAK